MGNECRIIPSIGEISTDSGWRFLDFSSCKNFRCGQNGVTAIATTKDQKVEFIAFKDSTIAYVKSEMGYPAYYPVHPLERKDPIKAVLMDLDGTSVRSEEFWIWIIEKTTASLLNNQRFSLEDTDLSFVSGHSVSEHLTYCINKYCPHRSIEDARNYYFMHTRKEMQAIGEGKGRQNAFKPVDGLKDFLCALKDKNIKIGLVTSGLFEKAWPELLSAFKTLNLGNPKDFYDAIISAGQPLRKGEVGTLGELCPKPHPWLYAETCRIGLGIPFEQRGSVIGIEDSGAGVCSVRLAGFTPVGISGGNIIESGTKDLCSYYVDKLENILCEVIK